MARLRTFRSMKHCLSRFGADRSGATAVEFAFVAFPFFTLLFAIIQTSMVMFGSQALQTMTTMGSRKIMTGEMKSKSFDDFKAAMCAASMSAMFDCDKLLIQVQSFANFSDPSTVVIKPKCFKFDPPPTAAECYNAGAKEQFVIVRVAYDWPFAVNLEDLDHKTRITAVAAFRNEPF
jgi:Flp pilus assembly protein TadG